MKLKHLFENEITAKKAYKLAIQKGTPVPEYEDIIAEDSQYAYLYAIYIIKGRFPAGEPAIAKDSWYAYWYATEVIKGRFPAGEPAIAKHSDYAYWYATEVIKGRFPAGEPAISRYAYLYKLFLYDNNINFDDLEQQSSEKGPLIIDKHIISDIPNKVKDSQLIKLMKLSFPEVEDDRIVDFLKSKKQSSNSELPVITWKEYMKKKKRKYQPRNKDDFS